MVVNRLAFEPREAGAVWRDLREWRKGGGGGVLDAMRWEENAAYHAVVAWH